jgi:hypothetical protein
MILPTGGPRDRTEWEIQRESSLGAPNWMRETVRTDLPDAERYLESTRERNRMLFEAGMSNRLPQFRVIERTITEKVLPL